MSYNLFLDDIRQPVDASNYILPVALRNQYRLEPWVVVRSIKQFVDYIQEHGIPAKVSFDHDLSQDHYHISFRDWDLDVSIREMFDDTGYDAAKWLCAYCKRHDIPLPECYVHSANPVGRENIKRYLENFKKHGY